MIFVAMYRRLGEWAEMAGQLWLYTLLKAPIDHLVDDDIKEYVANLCVCVGKMHYLETWTTIHI